MLIRQIETSSPALIVVVVVVTFFLLVVHLPEVVARLLRLLRGRCGVAGVGPAPAVVVALAGAELCSLACYKTNGSSALLRLWEPSATSSHGLEVEKCPD